MEGKSLFFSFRGFRNLPRTTCSSLQLEMDVWKMIHMGVSKNRDTPNWMVKIMENPIKLDDLGGKSTIFRNPHILLGQQAMPARPIFRYSCCQF